MSNSRPSAHSSHSTSTQHEYAQQPLRCVSSSPISVLLDAPPFNEASLPISFSFRRQDDLLLLVLVLLVLLVLLLLLLLSRLNRMMRLVTTSSNDWALDRTGTAGTASWAEDIDASNVGVGTEAEAEAEAELDIKGNRLTNGSENKEGDANKTSSEGTPPASSITLADPVGGREFVEPAA